MSSSKFKPLTVRGFALGSYQKGDRRAVLLVYKNKKVIYNDGSSATEGYTFDASMPDEILVVPELENETKSESYKILRKKLGLNITGSWASFGMTDNANRTICATQRQYNLIKKYSRPATEGEVSLVSSEARLGG